MTFKRTFRRDRIFHKHMAFFDLPFNKLDEICSLLSANGFIELLPDDRYSETEKLEQATERKKLYSILREVRRR